MTPFDRILHTTRPEELFGDLGKDLGEQQRNLTKAFRALALSVHPDRQAPRDKHMANEALLRLNARLAEAETRLEAGLYGTSKPTPIAPPTSPTIITRARSQIVVTAALGVGDICALHRADLTEQDRPARTVLMKVALAPADNDLVMNEATVLKALKPKGTPEASYHRYLPTLIDAFAIPHPGGARQINLLAWLDGFHSLAAVCQAYPTGLVLEDVVWMFNRMLEGIGFVHKQGFVHGAIVPAHVMIRPENHAGVFVDWSYAVKIGEPIKAISTFGDPTTFYPPEVFAKRPATPATDIYMIARCAKALAGSRPLPAYVTRFLDACLLAAPTRRPPDAWGLLDDFQHLMKTNYGPRKFHKFVMPT